MIGPLLSQRVEPHNQRWHSHGRRGRRCHALEKQRGVLFRNHIFMRCPSDARRELFGDEFLYFQVVHQMLLHKWACELTRLRAG